MIKDAGDGQPERRGAYGKDPQPNAGAVYVVAGSAGQATGGPLNHPAMFASLNVLGSMVLDFLGDQLTARFLDSTGSMPDHFVLTKAPLVTVSAPVAVTGPEQSPAGRITLTRECCLDSALSVQLTIGGTATPDSDYLKLVNPVTIPAGVPFMNIFVQPMADDRFEGPETVIVSAVQAEGYRIRSPRDRATVIIKDEQMETWRAAKFGNDAGNVLIGGDDADPDGDHQTNTAEFLAGTDPRDNKSFFAAKVSRNAAGSSVIEFDSAAGRSYTVLFKDDLSRPEWEKLLDVAAPGAGGLVRIIDPGAVGRPQRFYRVVAP
jgi:hypothetical protein